MMRWLGLPLVVTGIVLAPAAGAQGNQGNTESYQEGFNRTSEHYELVEKGHPKRCQDACIGDNRCFAWAFNKNGDMCRLMNLSPPVPPQADACCVTGIKLN